MNYHAFSLIQAGLKSLGLSLFIYLLFARKKPGWSGLRNLFNWNRIRNLSIEQITLFACRKAAAFFFYSGLFLLMVAVF
jgi:hypothetical protein